MPYRLRESGDRVILSVLIGADQSMIGLSVKHSKIISMKFGELDSIIQEAYGIAEKNRFLNSVMDHYRPSTTPGKVLNLSDCDLVVLETICENPGDLFAPETILKAMKLYHGADIYSCYSVNYRFEDGKICFGGLGETVQYRHAIGFVKPHYSLTEQEKTDFPAWYSSVFLRIIQIDHNDSYKSMIRTYDTSYLLGICESEYITLFSILEMLLGSGNTEITYQISRGTALILSNSENEMLEIYKQMKKLYKARSQYVHSGKTIAHEHLFDLREIVRKVLIRIAELGYHSKEKTFDELREKILLGGYRTFVKTEKED